MKYRKEITLKSGESLLLCSLKPQDAQESIWLLKKTAEETLYMMRYPDEWIMTGETQREVLAQMEHAPKALMLGAFMDGHLIGIGNFRPVHPGDRARHRAGMGISILKSCWGKGVGTAMMHALIEAAKATALEQLELDVVSTNERAIRLYERFGFEVFARHPRKLKYRDGTYADMLLMVLDLRSRR